jgi:hypothetical protein
MPTQQEVRDDLKRKLKLEMRRTLVWADVAAAFGAATLTQIRYTGSGVASFDAGTATIRYRNG